MLAAALCRSVGGCVLQDDDSTLLSIASCKGHEDCVRLLLDRGAGVDEVAVSLCLVVLRRG
jgi:hypothetical protein